MITFGPFKHCCSSHLSGSTHKNVLSNCTKDAWNSDAWRVKTCIVLSTMRTMLPSICNFFWKSHVTFSYFSLKNITKMQIFKISEKSYFDQLFFRIRPQMIKKSEKCLFSRFPTIVLQKRGPKSWVWKGVPYRFLSILKVFRIWDFFSNFSGKMP